jgi:hypothetical protein
VRISANRRPGTSDKLVNRHKGTFQTQIVLALRVIIICVLRNWSWLPTHARIGTLEDGCHSLSSFVRSARTDIREYGAKALPDRWSVKYHACLIGGSMLSYHSVIKNLAPTWSEIAFLVKSSGVGPAGGAPVALSARNGAYLVKRSVYASSVTIPDYSIDWILRIYAGQLTRSVNRGGTFVTLNRILLASSDIVSISIRRSS